MQKFQIKRILVPTDFSETGQLALEHAVFMASLYKADLYLLHVIEVTETSYSIYNPAVTVRDLKQIEEIVEDRLITLAKKIKKENGIVVNTICSNGRTAHEIQTIVKDNKIDVVVMGTHGANGVGEYFIGSNAHKTVTLCPCPVITVQKHAKKLGYSNIILPIDNALHSRQKVNFAIAIAKKYAAKIHILGLFDKTEGTDLKKFTIKMEAVTKAITKAGLRCDCKTVMGKRLAVEAIKYSDKVKGDLIVIMTDHESNLTGMFLGAFAKQIVNHSSIPVMSIRPEEGLYDSIDLSAASPF